MAAAVDEGPMTEARQSKDRIAALKQEALELVEADRRKRYSEAQCRLAVFQAELRRELGCELIPVFEVTGQRMRQGFAFVDLSKGGEL